MSRSGLGKTEYTQLSGIQRAATFATGIVVSFLTSTTSVYAVDATEGKPVAWATGFQLPVTEVAEGIQSLHNGLMIVLVAISVFVMVLLGIVYFKFRERRNPNPRRFTHHVGIEIAWTVVPALILIFMIAPTLKLLYLQEGQDDLQPDMVIKATGHQWYWNYQYPEEEIAFDSLMIGPGISDLDTLPVDQKDQLQQELAAVDATLDEWRLATDTFVVVPINKTIQVQVTGADVMHNWMVPSFGSKVDAVPGRLNTTWFRAEKEGIYYGQCSELCGAAHAYMPIAVKVVSEEEYAAWVLQAKEEYAVAPVQKPVETVDAPVSSQEAKDIVVAQK